MIISDYTDKVFDILKEDLGDIKVIKAYPLSHKPTRMTEPIVTVSPYSLEQHPLGFGEYASDADIMISVDVFVPYSSGIDALNDVADSILMSRVTKDICSVKLDTPKSDKLMDCISVKLLLGYNAYIGD